MSSLVEEHAAIAAALRDDDRGTADARLLEHLRVARARSGGVAAQRP
jgi:DNA-binding GntR family transcriptional regulator